MTSLPAENPRRKHPLEPALSAVAVTLRQRNYPEHEVEAILLMLVSDVAAGRAPLSEGYLNVPAVELRFPELPQYRQRLPVWVAVVIVAGVIGLVGWGGFLQFGSGINLPFWAKWAIHGAVLAWPAVVVWAYFRRSPTLPASVRQAAQRVGSYPFRAPGNPTQRH